MGDKYTNNLHLPYLIYKLFYLHLYEYHNLNLGFMTKAKACESMGQEGSLGVTIHIPRSARKCEGMNLHTRK